MKYPFLISSLKNSPFFQTVLDELYQELDQVLNDHDNLIKFIEQ